MQDENKGIQVICAGLGRTGTLSLTLALQELGYRPYHYVDFAHAAAWADHCSRDVTLDRFAIAAFGGGEDCQSAVKRIVDCLCV